MKMASQNKQLVKAPSESDKTDQNIKLHLHFRDLVKSEKNNGAGENFQHKIQGKMLEEKKIIARKTTEQFLNKINSNQSPKETNTTLKEKIDKSTYFN